MVGYSRAFSSVIAKLRISFVELVGHIAAETLLAEHSHHHYILHVGRQRVGRAPSSPSAPSFVLKVEQSPLLGRFLNSGFISHVNIGLGTSSEYGWNSGIWSHCVVGDTWLCGEGIVLNVFVSFEAEAYELIVLATRICAAGHEQFKPTCAISAPR